MLQLVEVTVPTSPKLGCSVMERPWKLLPHWNIEIRHFCTSTTQRDYTITWNSFKVATSDSRLQIETRIEAITEKGWSKLWARIIKNNRNLLSKKLCQESRDYNSGCWNKNKSSHGKVSTYIANHMLKLYVNIYKIDRVSKIKNSLRELI